MTEQTITAEELDKFTTSNRREILFYLHQLINDGERVSVVFDGGKETVLTMLLDVDAEGNRLIFDWGGSETVNRKLLVSDRNHFVCSPHGVKNQFTTGTVGQTTYRKRPAFVTALPSHYTRLQRREFFRLVLPITRRPPCIVPRAADNPWLLSVIDISIGGIAAEMPGGKPDVAIGQVLRDAQIELKGIGTLTVDLEIRNCYEVHRAGKTSGRIGCQFVRLGRALEHQLQRFITDVQREERARLGA
jgi:c-di-GMP-binding flagellar brake protein YcgR